MIKKLLLAFLLTVPIMVIGQDQLAYLVEIESKSETRTHLFTNIDDVAVLFHTRTRHTINMDVVFYYSNYFLFDVEHIRFSARRVKVKHRRGKMRIRNIKSSDEIPFHSKRK